MKSLRDLSIRNKLIAMTLTIALFSIALGFALVIMNDLKTFRKDMVDSTTLTARIIADYSVVDLDFYDRVASEKTLSKLSSFGNIEYAYLFDARGKIFSIYNRSGRPPRTATPMPPSVEFAGNHLDVYQTVTDGEKTYGTIYLRASTWPLRLKIRNYLLTMISIMIGLVVVSVLLAFKLQAIISRPILDLADAAKKISEGEDYSIRVNKSGADEIGVLCDGFNKMLEQIETRRAQRDEAEQQLRQYADELERSNRELDQFAYVTSHDLKAPLQAISNLSEWIEEDLGDKVSGESQKHMDLLRRRVRRMVSLIEGVLEFSRVRRIHQPPEVVHVDKLLAEVIDMVDKPPGFVIKLPDQLPTVETEKVRLQQVFANLIGNAIKHHESLEGKVEVSCEEMNEFYRFSVADDGPGIAPEFHEKVFMIFQTLKPRDKFESTGVGLALVKRIVEDKGGLVELESQEGAGATFRFTWPKRPRGSL